MNLHDLFDCRERALRHRIRGFPDLRCHLLAGHADLGPELELQDQEAPDQAREARPAGHPPGLLHVRTPTPPSHLRYFRPDVPRELPDTP